MKILVNRTMVGKKVECSFCGSTLLLESADDYQINVLGEVSFTCAACRMRNHIIVKCSIVGLYDFLPKEFFEDLCQNLKGENKKTYLRRKEDKFNIKTYLRRKEEDKFNIIIDKKRY